MTIQRFELKDTIEGTWLSESDKGGWVSHFDHLAAMQRERECREKLVGALEEIKACMGGDDCDGWNNPNAVWGITVAALAAAEERSAPEVCEDTLEEKIADHQRDMDEEVWGGDL